MESSSNEKSTFNQKHLLIDHNIIDLKYHSDDFSNCKYKLDENVKKLIDFISNKEKFKIKSFYEHQKEDLEFLRSKFETMEKMNFDDECFVEVENEAKKINKDENILQKEQLNSKNGIKISENKINVKNISNKNNNKNIVINVNGKVDRNIIENIDYVDIINLDVDEEIKEKEFNNFFSNKILLNSIINEIKGE